MSTQDQYVDKAVELASCQGSNCELAKARARLDKQRLGTPTGLFSVSRWQKTWSKALRQVCDNHRLGSRREIDLSDNNSGRRSKKGESGKGKKPGKAPLKSEL